MPRRAADAQRGLDMGRIIRLPNLFCMNADRFFAMTRPSNVSPAVEKYRALSGKMGEATGERRENKLFGKRTSRP
jgi:hypothetical protein